MDSEQSREAQQQQHQHQHPPPPPLPPRQQQQQRQPPRHATGGLGRQVEVHVYKRLVTDSLSAASTDAHGNSTPFLFGFPLAIHAHLVRIKRTGKLRELDLEHNEKRTRKIITIKTIILIIIISRTCPYAFGLQVGGR